MRDGLDFQREVARFSGTDASYIVDVLRGAYSITAAGSGDDSEMTLLIGDFIAALEDCDCIEIVDDEEMLVDEN